MSKQVLSVEQMQHLKELGLEFKFTMFYHTRIKCDKNDEWDLTTVNELSEYMFEQIPAYTLQDILDVLPKVICDSYDYYLNLGVNSNNKLWTASYDNLDTQWVFKYINDKTPIDAAYKLLCWAIENGYVENE